MKRKKSILIFTVCALLVLSLSATVLAKGGAAAAPTKAAATASSGRWGAADAASITVLRAAYGIAVTERSITMLKMQALSQVIANVEDRIALLSNNHFAGMQKEQIAALQRRIAELSAARKALDGARQNILACRAVYTQARNKGDINAATKALSDLSGCYDRASDQANVVGGCLQNILTVLRDVPLVSAPAATPSASVAATAKATEKSASAEATKAGH